MSLKHNFGRQVRFLRKKAGLTQEQLAEKLGISLNTVGTIERGEKFVSPGTIEKLANTLKCSVQLLFAFNGAKQELSDNQENKAPIIGTLRHKVGLRIKSIRTERFLTQVELAEKTGFSRSQVFNYESGIKTPSLEDFELLSNVLNVPVHQFFTFLPE